MRVPHLDGPLHQPRPLVIGITRARLQLCIARRPSRCPSWVRRCSCHAHTSSPCAGRKRPGAAATASADAPDTPFKHGTLSRDFDTARGAARGFDAVAGVDEAGRGPLAGPVVAAACVVASDVRIEGIHDSKLLTEPERELLYDALVAHPGVSWAVSVIDHDVIDEINILQATMRAMERAVASLPSPPQLVLVDGPRVPAGLASDEALTAEPVVKGDSKSYSIAAASVIAKVTRDRIMMKVHAEYPQYGFAQHKGYPTRDHVAAVHRHGPCPIHRRTFAPIKHMKLK